MRAFPREFDMSSYGTVVPFAKYFVRNEEVLVPSGTVPCMEMTEDFRLLPSGHNTLKRWLPGPTTPSGQTLGAHPARPRCRATAVARPCTPLAPSLIVATASTV